MTDLDVHWFKQCHAAGLVQSKLLEVGSAKVQGIPNLCEIAKSLGIEKTTGTDVDPTYDGVDTVADFGLSPELFKIQYQLEQFATVCIFNVLEHTFDPITVLTNAVSCLAECGSLLVVTPSIWPIHNFPRDYGRLLPDWYLEFARRHHLNVVKDQFCWLSQFGIQPINSYNTQLPNYSFNKANASSLRYWTSRIAHKVLNTYGRSHWATHSAIAAAFVKC